MRVRYVDDVLTIVPIAAVLAFANGAPLPTNPAGTVKDTEPARVSKPGIGPLVLPASLGRGTVLIARSGRNVLAPNCVARALAMIAATDGQVRIRIETWRKFRACLPDVAEVLQPVPDAKVVNKARLYTVPADLRGLISVSNRVQD